VSSILAIESDPRQAAALSRVVKDRVPGAQLTVVDSKDGALASIRKKAPDLILVTALFSPRQEEELIAHLRTLEGAEHLQTVTIPLLAASDDDDDGRGRRGLFGFKKKKAEDLPTRGCDPVVFAEQIAGYLKTATEMKANIEAAKLAAERAAQRAASEAAASTAAVLEVQRVEIAGDGSGETILVDPAEPVIAADPQPVVAYPAEPSSAPAPEPLAAPAPSPDPVLVEVRKHPLVGYSANSLGELLSKEKSVESAPRPDPAPVAEPQLFGSVLFAKVRPKREIKPFTEAPPVTETKPVTSNPPASDEIPIAAESSVTMVPPVEAPPMESPQYVEPAYDPALALDSIEKVPVYEPEPAFQSPILVSASLEPLARFSRPEPPPPPAPVDPVRLVERLPPLAMWARRLQESEAIPAGDNGHSSNRNDEGPLAVLRIPPEIATISYPTGCRIRRVVAKSA
jgi:hypothetical protein